MDGLCVGSCGDNLSLPDIIFVACSEHSESLRAPAMELQPREKLKRVSFALFPVVCRSWCLANSCIMNGLWDVCLLPQRTEEKGGSASALQILSYLFSMDTTSLLQLGFLKVFIYYFLVAKFRFLWKCLMPGNWHKDHSISHPYMILEWFWIF